MSPIIHPIFIRKYGSPPINSACVLDQAGIQLKPPKKRTPKAATTRQLLGGSSGQPLSWVELWHFWGSGMSPSTRSGGFQISTEKGDVKQPKLPQDWWFMQQEVGWMRIMEECQAVWIPNHHLSKKKNIFLAVCLLGINQALSMLGWHCTDWAKSQPRCSLNQEVWIYSIYEGEAANRKGKTQVLRSFDPDP